uniref:Retrovirus-related Pol polyprotein from transposon TNT 1-94 n=1 Tax=Cajanus cajan TaxID=3821 RepID=A0A151R669_CAJCA|nr:Retrovirus-related Pol polyprotein from transposon TNT 1-94 [Cajanus cajan]
MGNDIACKVAGIGTVRIKFNDGSVKVSTKVRHVPELKRNLISLGMLVFNGESDAIVIKRGSKQIMKGIRKDGLYRLQGKTIVNSANSIRLWHLRLSHISEKGLEELHKQGLLKGTNYEKLDFCEHCLYGKQERAKFPASTHNTKGILDYVHSDIWGPTKTQSIGGVRYYISFIDDWSTKMWIYLLNHKNQAFKIFKQWKALVETQIGKQVKVLSIDNGLEYLSDEFNEFCKDNGITRHKTIRVHPQQNGLAEIMNRTILGRVRCMLSNANLSKLMRDRSKGTIHLSQESYVEKVFKSDMFNAEPVSTLIAGQFKLSSDQSPSNEEDYKFMSNIPYANAIGSLMYAMVYSRSDIACEASLVSRFMGNPGKKHWMEVNWMLRYLKRTPDIGLRFSAICLFKNQKFHERTKHINVRFHFIRDIIPKGVLQVSKIGTENNPVNMLTKVIPTYKFEHCLYLLSIQRPGE